MKVLLVNPTRGPIEEYGAMHIAGTVLPQLGLASIATTLRHAGCHVRVVDRFIEHLTDHDICELARTDGYGMIGISVCVTTFTFALHLAKALKAILPNVYICVGGPQVTLTPDLFLQPYVDYVFVGEADLNFVQLVQAIETGNTRPPLFGLLWNDGHALGGDRRINLVEDLDALPLVEMDQFYDLSGFYPPIHMRGHRAINIMGVRGCPYKCTVCAAGSVCGRKLRRMSVERFVDQIEYYTRAGFDSFMIYDDTFTIDQKRTAKISHEILKRRLRIAWNCFSRVDCVDIETLCLMREAGCYMITFGCESFNDKTLDKLRKGFTTEQCLRGIETTKQAGIQACSSFMLGLPGETQEDILNTIRIVNHSALDFVLYPIFEPYPGTPIWDDCQREGRWVSTSDQKADTILTEGIWEPYGLRRVEIERLARYGMRTFYLRPKFACTLLRLLYSLPLERNIRWMKAGLDYFLLGLFRRGRTIFRSGSRYR